MSDERSERATQSTSASEREEQYRQQTERLQARVQSIRHQILVLSGKGGVGKSMVATNLACGLAESGWRVGLLDADVHGPSVPLMLGLTEEHPAGAGEVIIPVAARENLLVMSLGLLLGERDAPVIWRGPLRSNLLRQFIADVEWGDLDFLVVDLPPGTGDEPLTIAQSFPHADGGIVVTTPQEASLADCRKAVNFVRAVELPVLGVIENMSGFVCPHCGKETDIFTRGGGEAMAAEMGVPFLGRIPLAAEIVQLGDTGQSLLSAEAPPAVREVFKAVLANVVARVGES